MSFSTASRLLPSRFRIILASFLQEPGLPFAEVLPEERIQAVFAEEQVGFAQEADGIYTPAVTLWAFLSQVLFKGEQRSCVAAVSRVVVLLVSLGRQPPSGDTGVYCRARAKLSEVVLRRLTSELADGCERDLPQRWLWHGRHVKLVDGSTASMPDTPANQVQYPHHTAQQPGLGFPIARFVVLLSLASGMTCDLAIGPYAGKQTGEMALLRELLTRLNPGDILLADRYYCSYFMICLLLAAKVDFVVRLHQMRKADFRRGRSLSAGDHIVQWQRPARPQWMDQATYDQMPESISVREVEVAVPQPGFRAQKLVIVTTLLDARRYTRNDVAELYHARWLAELDLRAIKVTLGMDVLRCKTPEMVRREIWACLLVYNLVRQTILNAAKSRALAPRQISFTAAMQQIAAAWTSVALMDGAAVIVLVEHYQQALAQQQVGDRPDRVEPRAIKRRPKPHRLLTKSRRQAREELLAGNR